MADLVELNEQIEDISHRAFAYIDYLNIYGDLSDLQGAVSLEQATKDMETLLGIIKTQREEIEHLGRVHRMHEANHMAVVARLTSSKDGSAT